jgi:hypothetical protein
MITPKVNGGTMITPETNDGIMITRNERARRPGLARPLNDR